MNLTEDSQCPDRNVNHVPPKQKRETLPTEPAFSVYETFEIISLRVQNSNYTVYSQVIFKCLKVGWAILNYEYIDSSPSEANNNTSGKLITLSSKHNKENRPQ